MITIKVLLDEKEPITLDASNYAVEINGESPVGESAVARLSITSKVFDGKISEFYNAICTQVAATARVSAYNDSVCLFESDYFTATYNVSVVESTERLEFVKKY